jgi:hypothetical protein
LQQINGSRVALIGARTLSQRSAGDPPHIRNVPRVWRPAHRRAIHRASRTSISAGAAKLHFTHGE